MVHIAALLSAASAHNFSAYYKLILKPKIHLKGKRIFFPLEDSECSSTLNNMQDNLLKGDFGMFSALPCNSFKVICQASLGLKVIFPVSFHYRLNPVDTLQ